jgi:CRP/FNR family transcriptional regulator, cyclic AMP receptor protein
MSAPGTLLHALSPDDREALIRLGGPRVFQPGEALIHEGVHDTDAFLLLKGFCKVVSNTATGRAVLLSVRVGGEVVGELSALDDKPRSATVVACTRVVAREISQRTFLRYMSERPSAALAIRCAVVEELRRATRFRACLSGGPVSSRLAFMLDYLAAGYGSECAEGVRIEVPFSQPELASLIGASEPSLHRALTRMRQAGIIRTGYRHIIVRDHPALRALAETDR